MRSTTTRTTNVSQPQPESSAPWKAAAPPPDEPKAPRFAALKERLYWGASDIVAVTWRNLIAYTRIPEAMVFSSIQPIMFVLLFRYVFGGAVSTPGFRYVDFLMPGIFVQTVCFGAVTTGIGLADDLGKGLIERFRSMPMARCAVLAGRTTADMCRNLFVVLLMTVVGVAVGFRSSTGFFSFMAGVLLLLLFAYALSWGFAVVGMVARNAETAQAMAFPLLFPLTFASSAFVQVQSMPGWLQVFARHQPVTVVIDACRNLMVGGSGSPLAALVWTAAILAVCIPLAVRKYRRAS
jgi:ABC-2 type transport system permease protein/oleandomycin transport system permease protein